MRVALLVISAATVSLAAALQTQTEKLTPATFPEFLSRYEAGLRPVDEAYAELENENLPLRDEMGQPLVGRRRIIDRRQRLEQLLKTLHQLEANPPDLVLTTTLLVQTEALADDLFDLSQMAYDNDREELAKRLSDTEATMDHNADLVEAYTLDLAALKQQRIEELEKENRGLQQKLKEFEHRGKSRFFRL